MSTDAGAAPVNETRHGKHPDEINLSILFYAFSVSELLINKFATPVINK